MKYIITESQYKLLVEQSMSGGSEGTHSGNKEEIVKGWRDSIKKKAVGYEKVNSSQSIDDAIDIVSGALDTVPGLGNVASLTIDLIHALSYYVRIILPSSTSEKVENFLLGILTAVSSLAPVGGNAAMVAARPTINQVMRMTPQSVLLALRNMGFNVPNSMSKQPWKPAVLWALVKIYGEELAQDLIGVVSYLETEAAKYTFIKKITDPVISTLKEFINVLETKEN